MHCRTWCQLRPHDSSGLLGRDLVTFDAGFIVVFDRALHQFLHITQLLKTSELFVREIDFETRLADDARCCGHPFNRLSLRRTELEGRLKEAKAILLLISNPEAKAMSRFHDIKLSAGIDLNYVSEGKILHSQLRAQVASMGVTVNMLMNVVVLMRSIFSLNRASLVVWWFFYFLLPETKRKTLKEIETLFSNNTTRHGKVETKAWKIQPTSSV
ncbi:hypothetical protein GQ457_04G035470 [Hibiscus cannabinus]